MKDSRDGTQKPSYRVGVLFGGRSGEHEVSLASAQNVMAALEEAGHQVLPIGISRQGEWIATADPMGRLVAQANEDQATQEDHAIQEDQAIQNCATEATAGESKGGTDSAELALGHGRIFPATAQAGLPTMDVIFPVLHGPYGEDGTIQGLLETGNLPYVGCGVLSSAVAMDKAIAKKLFAAEEIPQTNYMVVQRNTWLRQKQSILNKIEESIQYPLFVKPANMGSSVGISKANHQVELAEAIDLASRYDRKIVVEEGVSNVRELEVSILGICGSHNFAPVASTIGEIVPQREFYDYEAKYEDEASELLIPAPLLEEQSATIREMAIKAFDSIDGSGLARVDFLMNGDTGDIFLNEVNTMPGFTHISMYPKLWEASGITYPKLVDRLIELALIRHSDRQKNQVY